ncbi:MAG: nucleotidyltransferase family protein [Caldisphaera sp.]|jgi:glucose-1-phosphate thymidylyltransferase|nr:nucleotidyltransferase family protein [Caldisphaera sp.]PMP59634.1 MAG: nucleotidyltransferase [Caldisphaera sp.]
MSLALILAGGYGKRLRPLTLDKPKPLIAINDKPVVVYQLEWLKHFGVDEIIMLAGYHKEKLIEELGSGTKYGVSISYVVEDEPLGTGGALKKAKYIFKNTEKFLVTNGDIITNINPNTLFDALDNQIIAVMAVVPLRSPYGVLDIDSSGLVKGFKEKPILYDYWINAGVYAFRPQIAEYLPDNGDIESTTFPKLANEGKMVAIKFELPKYYWRSIDTHKDLDEVSNELNQMGGLF